MADATSRLFFKADELEDYLPRAALDAMVAAAEPYAPKKPADPPPTGATADILELPSADMPIVVAARLSLSFPLLFSALPLYAIDYDAPPALRGLQRACWFTDGGVSVETFQSICSIRRCRAGRPSGCGWTARTRTGPSRLSGSLGTTCRG